MRPRESGFTLIELLIVLGIIALIGSLGVFAGADSFRENKLRAARSTLIDLLRRARTEAMNGGSARNVCLDADGAYVLFANSATQAKERVPNEQVETNGLPSCAASSITFAAGSGETEGWSIEITDQGRSAVVSVNSEGLINAEDSN